jgi:hypothetical protein
VVNRYDQVPLIRLQRGGREQRLLDLPAAVAATAQPAGEGLHLEEFQPLQRPHLHLAPAVATNAVDALGVGVQPTDHNRHHVLEQRRSFEVFPPHANHSHLLLPMTVANQEMADEKEGT